MSSPDDTCTICQKTTHPALRCNLRKGCVKCKSPQTHTALKCTKEYPKYNEEQVCAGCLSPHEKCDCGKTKNRPCGGCGHNDHKTRQCELVPFGTAGHLPNNVVDRFEKSFRENYLNSPSGTTMSTASQSQTTPATSAAPSVPASSSTQAAQPVNVPSSSLSQASQAAQPNTAASVPPAPNTGTGGAVAQLTPLQLQQQQQQQQQARWDATTLNLPTRRPPTNFPPNQRATGVLCNFFTMGLNTTTRLYRYTIDLSDAGIPGANGNNLSRETKRYLINELLTTPANRPSHHDWACDYKSTIISAGQELYPGLNADGQSKATPFHRTPAALPNQNGPPVPPVPVPNARILCNGRLDTGMLMAHVNGNQVAANWDPDVVLNGLNILTWKNINHMPQALRSDRAGKRFYPHILRDDIEEARLNTHAFLIRKGFFTSVRPGDGSVLLNVNTTTSAFYSPIRLDQWMRLKWPNGPPHPHDFQIWLRGVRVTLDCHVHRRKFSIWDISRQPINQITFGLQNTVVSTYLSQRK